jgi:hypothetical protein
MVDIYVRRVGPGFLLSFWHRRVAGVTNFPGESYFSLSCSSPSRSHSQSLLQSIIRAANSTGGHKECKYGGQGGGGVEGW